MLLEKKIPIILVLAESIKEEWPLPIKLALEEKRLLIVTACNDKVHRINHQSAYERNEIILSLANHIIIGYAGPEVTSINKLAEKQTSRCYTNRIINRQPPPS